MTASTPGGRRSSSETDGARETGGSGSGSGAGAGGAGGVAAGWVVGKKNGKRLLFLHLDARYPSIHDVLGLVDHLKRGLLSNIRVLP